VDKKAKKKIDSLHQRLQRLQQQLACAKKQQDESGEMALLQEQIADAEAELAKLKGA
jgi:hypothetical protein